MKRYIMKSTTYAVALLFAGLTIGCSDVEDDAVIGGGEGFEVSLSANQTELGTKVGYDEADDKISFFWHENDAISVFEEVASAKPAAFKMDDDFSSDDAASGRFNGRLYEVEEGDPIYAIYPQRSGAKEDPSALYVKMAPQKQVGDKLNLDCAIMSAQEKYNGLTNTSLSFKNHLALVRVTLTLPDSFEGTPSKFVISSPDMYGKGYLDITKGKWGRLHNAHIQEVELEDVSVVDNKITASAMIIPVTMGKILLSVETTTTEGKINVYDIYKTKEQTFEENKAYNWNVSGTLEWQELRRYRKTFVQEECYRDPYIMIHDGKYYMTYTSGKLQLPIWTNDNLTDPWTLLAGGSPENDNYSLDDLSYYDTDITANGTKSVKMWAPEIHYINKTGKWLATHTCSNRRSALVLSSVVEFTDGSWEEPAVSAMMGHQHDPSIYQEGDDVWLVSYSARITKFNDDMSDFERDSKGNVVYKGLDCNKNLSDGCGMGHEGSQIIKVGKKYVLFVTGWPLKHKNDILQNGTYNLYYATADKIEGPYADRRFVGRCLGHGTVFKDLNGKWWCTAFKNGKYIEPENIDVEVPADASIGYSMNKGGATLVPLHMELTDDGDVYFDALDPYYTYPGSEEAQDFGVVNN